jgi:hypothetical protein
MFSLLSASDVIEEQATSYPKSVDKVDHQSPVKTCILLFNSTSRLRTSTVVNHLTSEFNRSGLPVLPRTILQIGEIAKASFHKVHDFYFLQAQYVIVAEGHVMLQPLYE